MSRTYQFSGGPLDGQTRTYESGNADWWGFKHEDGEYNTIAPVTYRTNPPTMYWDGPDEKAPRWEWHYPEDVLVTDFEEHVEELLREQNDA